MDAINNPAPKPAGAENQKAAEACIGSEETLEGGRQVQADQVQADQGQADQGQTDQGQTDQGQTDQGQADQGQTDQGQADQGQADQARRGLFASAEPTSILLRLDNIGNYINHVQIGLTDLRDEVEAIRQKYASEL